MFHHMKPWRLHASRALDRGGSLQLSEGTRDTRDAPIIKWDVSGNCSDPRYRQLRTATPLAGGKLGRNGFDPVKVITDVRTIELSVRCRVCPGCLRTRAYQWRIRAVAECQQAVRTWFGTLTLSAQSQFEAISRARLRLAAHGIDFDGLSEKEQFLERHREINPEITRFVKRVRKSSGASLRILLVAEAHKSGAPHYHCLVHEVTDAPVRHSVLAKHWRLGFSKFNLVKDTRAAAYVCKYLNKSASARVRASKGYGLAHSIRPKDIGGGGPP